jgi:hypothetical protein
MFIPSWQEEMCDRAIESGKVPWPEWHRASGIVECKVCGRQYFDHPQAVPFLILRLLCDGTYVKL